MVEILGYLFILLVIGLIVSIPFMLYLVWLEIKVREEELLSYEEEWEECGY